MEEWKDIPGYEGYQCSTLGRIRSKEWIIKHWQGGDSVKPGKILKQCLNKIWPYLYVTFGPYKKTFRAHRLIAITWIPNPENKPEVNHKNGIQSDNRVDNLEWCTPSENIKHSFKIGTHTPTFGNRRLSIDQVQEIRYLLFCGATRKQLAKEFNLNYSTIEGIHTYKTWQML